MARLAEWLRAIVLALGAWYVWQVHYVATATEYPNFGAGDIFGYFLPAYELLAERMRAGQLAFWNPWQGAGVPMLATLQPGVLYPPRLILLFVEPATALGVLAIGHVILGVLATDRLCRRLGASALASAIGGMVFGASVALPRIVNPAQVEPAVWLPVAGWALVALVDGARWRAAIGLGLALAMPLLAGGYQVCIYVAYGVAFLGLALLVDRRWRPRVLRQAVVVRIAGAALIAVGTAMPQALPTLEWSAMTNRPVGQLTDEQIFPRFIQMIDVFRTTVPYQVLYRSESMAAWHLSIPVVMLAVVGIVLGRGLGLVLGLCAAATYLVMLGPGSPWFAVYRWLPGLGMFRFPIRLWVIVGFVAAVMAALGASRVGALLRWRGLRWTVEAALAVAVFTHLVWPGGNTVHYPWTDPPVKPPAFVATAKHLAGTDRAWLPGDRLDLGAGIYPRHGMHHHLRVLQDYEPLSARRLGEFLAAVAGVETYDNEPVQSFSGTLPTLRQLDRPHLLDLVAVRAIVTPSTILDAKAAGWRPIQQKFANALYLNPHALPRAYITSLVEFAPTEQHALSRLLPNEPRVRNGVVLVGSPDDADPATRTATQDEPVLPARFVRDDAEHLAIAVAPTRPGVLVVADAFADGWEARVDGVPRRLWQANFLVRGIEVRPGDQLVELAYRAPGFRAGVAVAIAAWALVGVLALVERRRAVSTG